MILSKTKVAAAWVALAIVATVASPVKADTVRLSDGTSCSVDIDESNLELSFKAEQGQDDSHSRYGYDYGYDNRNDNRVGVELTYKFGTPKRMDCNVLFEMEVERRQLELQLLKQKMKVMEAAEEIQW